MEEVGAEGYRVVNLDNRPAQPARHGRDMSAAAKAAMSRNLKAVWAAKT